MAEKKYDWVIYAKNASVVCPCVLSFWMWYEEMEPGFGERNGLPFKRNGVANLQAK